MKNSVPTLSLRALFARMIAFCVMLFGLCACASTPPPFSLNKLNMKRAIVVEPAHDAVIKLKIGDWGVRMPGPNQRQADEGMVNTVLAGWEDDVLSGYTDELVRGLEARGYTVQHMYRSDLDALRSGQAKGMDGTIVILGYVEAGFTYGTLTDGNLRPYLSLTTRYELGNGRPVGRGSFTISARSLNLFSEQFPPKDDYGVPTVESLQRDPSRHIAALRALAMQAGQQVLKETFY